MSEYLPLCNGNSDLLNSDGIFVSVLISSRSWIEGAPLSEPDASIILIVYFEDGITEFRGLTRYPINKLKLMPHACVYTSCYKVRVKLLEYDAKMLE